ncbi:MAG: flagellar export chaperone FlgN [Verrucomicrobiota bacterium]|nr:flagellar export chaperone FlgN [Verrucomicrobiota bacterium]
MNDKPWQPVIQALRAELEENGAMLALMNDQQTRIVKREAEEVAALAEQIESQSTILLDLRRKREHCVNTLGRMLQRPGVATLQDLLPALPEEIALLVGALIQEINQTISSMRRRSRQNHLLLTRLVELHHMVLPAMRPAAFAKTYTAHGAVHFSLVETASKHQFTV